MNKPNGRPANPQALRQQAIAAGLSPACVQQRVHKLKWTTERALSTPKRTVAKRATLAGVLEQANEQARENIVSEVVTLAPALAKEVEQ